MDTVHSSLLSARVLLVDDDPVMRELASAKLVEAGCEVLTAEDGAAALAVLETDGVDLVISDLDMPNLDGYALTECIRESEAHRETPIIVLTGSDGGDAVERVFSKGATSFLTKPVNWTLFHHSVRFILRASADAQALRAARDLAEAGSQFKDGLMSVMSHELRTPLNAIIGFGQLLGEQFQRENDHLHKEYADYIVDGGKRLLNSVSDMLLASDACSGPIAINEVDCTLGDIVEEASEAVDKVVTLAQAELKVVLHDADIEICCDRSLVSRALSKLIENAVKFSDRGVKIVVASSLLQDGSLAILIKDNGPGIEPDVLERVTQPFSQSDMSLRRSKEGLGLGLPLVIAIAKAHDAVFRLQSTPGAGAKAALVMPAMRVRSASGSGAVLSA